jgi:hypothetical protein
MVVLLSQKYVLRLKGNYPIHKIHDIAVLNTYAHNSRKKKDCSTIIVGVFSTLISVMYKIKQTKK